MSKKLNKQHLAKLTAVWYKKLADSGFDSVEWFDPKTGKGQNSDHLKRSTQRLSQKYSVETAEYYRICYQYFNFTRFHNRRDRFCVQLYIEGVPYREIIERARLKGKGYYYNAAGKQQLSLFSLHHIIKKFVKKAFKWHKKRDADTTSQSLLDQMNSESILYYGTGTEARSFKDDDY